MLTHDDEPTTKKSIIDDPNKDADLGDLAFAAQRGTMPGVIGGQSEDRGFAVRRGTMPGVVGFPGSSTSDDDRIAKAMTSEDELIPSKAMLGHSLSEIYSNKRIQPAVNRSSMERLNMQLASTDM